MTDTTVAVGQLQPALHKFLPHSYTGTQRLLLLINTLVSRYHLCTLGAAWTEELSHESMSRWTERTVGLQSMQEEEGSAVFAS